MSCFDTEERSNQVVAEFAGNGPDWYGQDNWGSFNFNCPDFQFFEWRTLDLSPWRIEYEGADPIHIRDLNGKDHFIGSENEAINGLAFEFLRTVMHDELGTLKTKRASMILSRRRFGIQLLDSTFREFWHTLEIGS